MKNQQKKIGLFCLIFTAYINNSCGLIIKEHYSTLEYKFVNKTNKQISFNKAENGNLILPNSSGSTYFRGFKSDEMNEDYFTKKPPLTGICRPCIIYFDLTNCDTLNGNGPENRAKYDYFKKVDNNNWQIQYTFTEADYKRSKPCN